MKRFLLVTLVVFTFVGCASNTGDKNASYDKLLKTYKTDLVAAFKPESPFTYYHSGNAIISKYEKATKKEKPFILGQAIDNYKKAIELEPAFAPAYYALAVVYNKDSKEDLAIEELEKCININPDFVNAQIFLSYLAEKKGNKKLAVEVLENVIEIAPENETALILLGNLKLKSEDYVSAQKCFEKVLELAPGNKIALLAQKKLEGKVVKKPEKVAEAEEVGKLQEVEDVEASEKEDKE